jgi:hypothetical protein
MVQTAMLDVVEYFSDNELSMKIAVEASKMLFSIPNAINSQLYNLYEMGHQVYDVSFRADVVESSPHTEL